MTFGGTGNTKGGSIGGGGYGGSTSTTSNPALRLPAFPARAADASVLLAGLMGLQPRNNAALSTRFNTGTSSGLGRRPALAKRVMVGGL